jgi:hypothetical protein
MFRRPITPTAAVDEIAAAFEARDIEQLNKSIQRLIEAARKATPEQIQPAAVRLASFVDRLAYAPGGELGRIVGSIADMGTDPVPVLPTLVERACEVMEDAARFAEKYRELLGEDPPSPEDESAIGDTIQRFTGAAVAIGLDEDAAELQLQAWFAGDNCVQPVLFLCQRADVRAALPQRDRLLAAVEPVREDLGTAHWLYGLLLVLDDVELTVVDRTTRRGYRVTIGGIGDNFQLHTLLAARLIGRESEGWLPGKPPTAAMVAAADGSGPPDPPGGVLGQFNLVDLHGKWIWNEGRPADIPVTEGERVVVIDPPPYARSWNAGRAYPLMKPTMRVDRQLSKEEAQAWLAKAKPSEH